jgi:hypothetical protein
MDMDLVSDFIPYLLQGALPAKMVKTFFALKNMEK